MTTTEHRPDAERPGRGTTKALLRKPDWRKRVQAVTHLVTSWEDSGEGYFAELSTLEGVKDFLVAASESSQIHLLCPGLDFADLVIDAQDSAEEVSGLLLMTVEGRKRQLTVLIGEQNIDLVQKVASRAYVLEKGRVVRTLTRQELADTERLAEVLAI